MAMKVKAARGVLWSFLEFGGGEGISFVVFLVLARLVTPDDFGIVAFAGVFVAFAQLFLVQGFSDAIVQRREIEPDHIYTAFWTNLAIATVFLIAIELGAGLLAEIFGQPRLAPVLRWLSLVFVSTALISTHQAVFRRELRFSSFALRALVGITLGGVVGVAMAFAGCGVWSLVGQQLTNGLASVIVIWATSDWHPHLRFSRRCFREMASFSANVIGSNLVGFLCKKTDVFLIGFFFAERQLGYYYLVQRILITMGLVTLAAVEAIVMPVLSRLQEDRGRFADTFATTLQLVQAVWMPAILGLGLIAPLLLPMLFGAQWRPSVPLLQVMTLTGFTTVFSYFSGKVLYAAGRPDANLRLSLLQVMITVAIYLPATRFGLIGVAAAFTAVSTAVIPFHLWMLHRAAGIDPFAVLMRSVAPAIATVAMIAGLGLMSHGPFDQLPPIAALAAMVVCGAVIYGAVLTALAPGLVRTMIELVESALGRSPLAAR
jgi:PST family polysaccharide transporter